MWNTQRRTENTGPNEVIVILLIVYTWFAEGSFSIYYRFCTGRTQRNINLNRNEANILKYSYIDRANTASVYDN